MVSPALRLILNHKPITVVAHLPRLLDANLSWRVTPSWQEHQTTVARLVAEGHVMLVPFTGVRGLLTLIFWRGTLPAGAIVLGDHFWIDTVNASRTPVSGRHYADPAIAAAQGLACRLSADPTETTPPSRLPPLVDSTARQLALTPSGPFVALAPWATAATRRWPLAHWTAFLEQVATHRPELQFVLLGSANEREHGEAIGGSAINLMGKLTLAETAALLSRARLLVCCDSGLMHIALGLKTPVVALFGSTDPLTRVPNHTEPTETILDTTLCPQQWAPCYAGLQRDPVCPSEVECLSHLTPERVAARALEQLAKTDQRQSPLETTR